MKKIKNSTYSTLRFTHDLVNASKYVKLQGLMKHPVPSVFI